MSERVGAFFDLDLTLLAVNSANLWLRYQWKQGELGVRDAVRSVGWLLRYKMAMLDIEEIARKGLRGVEGKREDAARDEVLRWYEAQVRQHLYTEGRDLIERHRAQGHRVVLLTGSSPYVSEPAVRDLRLDAYLCTRLEVAPDGTFTGRAVEPICYGQGKVHWATEYAEREGIDLKKSWFYTDSYTDLPMLRAVGNPVATNPDPRLRRLARKEGMPILDFSRGKTG